VVCGVEREVIEDRGVSERCTGSLVKSISRNCPNDLCFFRYDLFRVTKAKADERASEITERLTFFFMPKLKVCKSAGFPS